jgi:hypothetical protein
MSDTALDPATATAAGTDAIKQTTPPSPTYASLTRRAGHLRDRMQLAHDDVRELHRETQLRHLDERTAVIGIQDPQELLDELATRYGLSWTTIARMVGVTDAAIRKWRRNEHIGPENRRRLARATAFIQILNDTFPVGDVASWLEMRIADDATVTALDLFSEGRVDLLFELVGRRMSPHQVLESFDVTWRDTYRVSSRFVVTEGVDGMPAIVERPHTVGR